MALFAGGANGATGPAALQPQNVVLMTRNTGGISDVYRAHGAGYRAG